MRWRFVLVLWFGVALAMRTIGAPLPDVREALTLYDRGDYSRFFEIWGPLNVRAKDLFPTFDREATRWILEADVPGRGRRSLVAGAVGLEMAHRFRDQPADRAALFLGWSARTVRQYESNTPSEQDRLWYLASLAGMEEQSEAWPLVAGLEGPYSYSSIIRSLGTGGQLAMALSRYPDEPRLKLAALEAAEGRYHSDLRGNGGESVLENATPNSRAQSVFRGRIGSAAVPSAVAALSGIEQSYAVLGADGTLRAECQLRIGYLETYLGRPAGAESHLEAVEQATDERYVLYLSQYFLGRAQQTLNEHDAAMRSFERAIALVPNARSAATQLAAELFVYGRAADRVRAHDLLEAAYLDREVPVDPWALYGHGDARLWTLDMARLREALR